MLQHHHAVGEAGDLLDGVRHIDDRNAKLVAQALDQRQDLEPPLHVEGGERLVHEQELRRGEQSAADRDPLLLAA